VFLDLDHIKNIKDTLGHRVGDQLLIESAQRMKAHVREGDTIGHISGDEFCLIFEGIKDTKDTAPLIEKLLRVFDESFVVNDNIMHISASIGVAIYPDNSQDPDELLSFADAAMYEAKEAGRNTYRFYSKAMTEQALEYHIVQSSLKNALGRSQFFLVYQPQIDLNTNSLVGLEVLIRWQHPEQGMIPPNKFIPIAEQSGFIRELGAWILRTACLQGKVWLDEERDFGRMYVNIAGPQLHDEGFFEQVLDCLADTKFPANRLGLEVTEGFVMGASKHAVDTLLKLRNLGIELAIDDFGTGYSSLSYLKSLPINKLKIDQSFVRDIPEDSNDMAIAEAVIAMGRALNMEVIAEGVEKEVQAEFLRSKGCQEAQGYLYGRPLTVSELENWMKSTG
jgi:diguanylate cyclase (GGDEF)-like protein